ncbi:sensor histidine kinase [Plantactinospora sp. GCM10030261]|uniref:sensor histidine kinase n=1 Tax=Plantactinospora sp. GCM10030261 TaxID=3273420 RepID=UPI00361A756E
MATTSFSRTVLPAGRAVVGLLTDLLAGLVAVALLAGWALAVVLVPVGVGVALLPVLFTVTRRFTGWERRRIGRSLGRLVPQRYREPRSTTWLGRIREQATDVASWRDLGWLAIAASCGLTLGLTAGYLLLGALNAVTVPLWWWILPPGEPVTPLPGVAVTDWSTAVLVPLVGLAYLAVLLFAPEVTVRYARWGERVLGQGRSEHLAERVDYLSRTRAEMLEAHGTELRRIERDLHDGLQAKLVNANLYLGLLDGTLATDHPGRAHADAARAQIRVALTELRAVVRSIYPPILSDRGLVGALRAVADDCPVPCEVDVGPIGDLPGAIESAAYFGVTEALTNAVRHARPTQVRITVRRTPDLLTVRVEDDGVGGLAKRLDDGVAGTGIAGLRARLRAFGGTFDLDSPVGGPTEVRMELPCGW